MEKARKTSFRSKAALVGKVATTLGRRASFRASQEAATATPVPRGLPDGFRLAVIPNNECLILESVFTMCNADSGVRDAVNQLCISCRRLAEGHWASGSVAANVYPATARGVDVLEAQRKQIAAAGKGKMETAADVMAESVWLPRDITQGAATGEEMAARFASRIGNAAGAVVGETGNSSAVHYIPTSEFEAHHPFALNEAWQSLLDRRNVSVLQGKYHEAVQLEADINAFENLLGRLAEAAVRRGCLRHENGEEQYAQEPLVVIEQIPSPEDDALLPVPGGNNDDNINNEERQVAYASRSASRRAVFTASWKPLLVVGSFVLQLWLRRPQGRGFAKGNRSLIASGLQNKMPINGLWTRSYAVRGFVVTATLAFPASSLDPAIKTTPAASAAAINNTKPPSAGEVVGCTAKQSVVVGLLASNVMSNESSTIFNVGQDGRMYTIFAADAHSVPPSTIGRPLDAAVIMGKQKPDKKNVRAAMRESRVPVRNLAGVFDSCSKDDKVTVLNEMTLRAIKGIVTVLAMYAPTTNVACNAVAKLFASLVGNSVWTQLVLRVSLSIFHPATLVDDTSILKKIQKKGFRKLIEPLVGAVRQESGNDIVGFVPVATQLWSMLCAEPKGVTSRPTPTVSWFIRASDICSWDAPLPFPDNFSDCYLLLRHILRQPRAYVPNDEKTAGRLIGIIGNLVAACLETRLIHHPELARHIRFQYLIAVKTATFVTTDVMGSEPLTRAASIAGDVVCCEKWGQGSAAAELLQRVGRGFRGRWSIFY